MKRVAPPTLEKELKLRNFFTLSLGTIIGVGWITVLGTWLREAGSLGTVFAFMGGGFFMALIGLCYAEVAAMYPVSGGEVAYAYEIFGLRTSFASGWFLALSYIATVGFEVVSVGWILSALAPGIEGPVLYRVLGDDVHLGSLVLGLGVMALITRINYRGARIDRLLSRHDDLRSSRYFLGFHRHGCLRRRGSKSRAFFRPAESRLDLDGYPSGFCHDPLLAFRVRCGASSHGRKSTRHGLVSDGKGPRL